MIDSAYLVSAAGTPPEIFTTWDGTLRTLVGIVVGLAVGIAVGHWRVRRDKRDAELLRAIRDRGENWGRRARAAMNYLAVWTGSKYSITYVARLRSMLKRHGDRGSRFIVITDKPQQAAPHCDLCIDVSAMGLPGWWAKMALFLPAIRGWQPGVYFDLDTVIVSSVAPLSMDVPFGICENFTRAAGGTHWPCEYGSCCMVFGRGEWGAEVYAAFDKHRDHLMRSCGIYGDQKAIELLVAPEEVILLQKILPRFFFTGYRDLVQYRDKPPPNCAVVVFAGAQKPDNTSVPWVKRNWR